MHAHINQGIGTIMVVILVAGNCKSGKPTTHLLAGITDTHGYTHTLRQPLKERSNHVLVWNDLQNIVILLKHRST